MDELLAGRAAGLEVERVVVRGRPRQEIAALATDIGADLVVLARHGSSGLRSAFMGSTAEGVLHGSHCPVLVLPPPIEA
jgi:nucleotide-binding universal stress UspA family protein